MLPQKKCLRTSELQKQVVAMEMQRASDAVTIFELSSRLNEPGSRMASCTSAALTVMTGKPFNTREGNERQSWKPSRGGTLEQLTPRPPPLHYRLSCRLHESPARLCWPAAAQAMQSEAAPGRQMCCRGQQTGFGRPQMPAMLLTPNLWDQHRQSWNCIELSLHEFVQTLTHLLQDDLHDDRSP